MIFERNGVSADRMAGVKHFFLSTFILLVSAVGLTAQLQAPVNSVGDQPFYSSATQTDLGPRSFNVGKTFRVEIMPISGGSDLITIFGRTNYSNAILDNELQEVPLISILRDTLGDDVVENDRLRYLWVLSYADPSFAQKFTAGIPFLYQRTANKGKAGKRPPRPITDLNPPENDLIKKVFLIALKKFVIDQLALELRLPTLHYSRNVRDYKRSSIEQALALLMVFQAAEGKKVLSEKEMTDIQSRLMLGEKNLGSLMLPENLDRLHLTSSGKSEITRSHNWELLRQHCEAEGLYFEPLEMPDGTATHAVVWVDEADITANGKKQFDSRFFNIKSPWNDRRLMQWEGHSEVRWFDDENHFVDQDTPNSRSRKLIPLGLYGLDFPKIPILLIDFRDSSNPKKREMSKRILDDLMNNVFQVSVFNAPAVFLSRFIFDFVTRRKGIDVGRGSRSNSYSQLKLLVLLNESLDPGFSRELANRVEAVSLNPLENDLHVQIKIAREQYKNLITYAKDPQGLAARLDKDRGRELVRFKHNSTERVFMSIARVLSFGLYTHREKMTPELLARMDLRRQFGYHERNLLEIATKTVRPEIDSDLESLRYSLKFMSENGGNARVKTTGAIAKIFLNTDDREIRELGLLSLYRIGTKAAINEMLALYKDRRTEPEWRTECARFLKMAVNEKPNISPGIYEEVSRLSGD